MDKVKQQRQWMKSNFTLWGDIKSDQEMKLPQPPLEKLCEDGLEVISLPEISGKVLPRTDIMEIFRGRKSRRKYKEDSISLEELSFLLWATQGVEKVMPNNYATKRPVPSGGARHAFETYIAVYKVDGLKKGIYRYLALSHRLVFLFEEENLEDRVAEAANDQGFVGMGAVTFIWSCIPYRSEWRYSISAHKTMLLDAGHVCQNLYLACEAIDCGTCAIASYDQSLIDRLLKIDGEDEFTIYLAPVGKV